MSSSEFEQRVGWVVPDDSPIILLTDKDQDAQKCIYNMGFIGLDQFVTGFLEGGLTAWMASKTPKRRPWFLPIRLAPTCTCGI